MEEGQRVNPRDLPILAGMTTGELEDMLKRVNSDILYDEGLDQLPQILEVLTSIADRASEVREGLKLVGESMKLIAESFSRLVAIAEEVNK